MDNKQNYITRLNDLTRLTDQINHLVGSEKENGALSQLFLKLIFLADRRILINWSTLERERADQVWGCVPAMPNRTPLEGYALIFFIFRGCFFLKNSQSQW